MKIAVFGAGYVGLVCSACFSDFGIDVMCIDIDEEKIEKLNHSILPVFEPGLEELLKKNLLNGRLKFSSDSIQAIHSSEIIFITVGTPNNEHHIADLTQIYELAAQIGKHINGYKVIAIKSTVPVGTNRKVREVIEENINERNMKIEFDVVSNPEFLREGKAIYDFTHPDKIVIGSDNENATDIIKKLYKPIYIGEIPFICCDIESAELIKYACNAFLATKIAFINEMANLCERTGGNINAVAYAMGKDGRIGSKFLHPGPGFGGSCFPKDLLALTTFASENGVSLDIATATYQSNNRQKKEVVNKLRKRMVELRNKKIAVLGLTFKAETDDIRESAALEVIAELLKEGCHINAYDPKGMDNMKKIFPAVNYSVSYKECVKDADAVVILTEWHELRNLDLNYLKKNMRGTLLYDSRNLYNRSEVEQLGLIYIGTGV
ncbi:MAG: UDP-glucose/GDP-mannose dehydrogenase family protein [Clostridia bacterium]|nr:UDP-glucose/GDP-mannose dehydrogenase family protein [Clostridia bacterium]